MDLHAKPMLAPGCRLHPTQPVVLIPEGTLQLSGPTREILTLLDGQRTVSDVVDALMQQYEGAERDEIEGDVVGLLERLTERGIVRF